MRRIIFYCIVILFVIIQFIIESNAIYEEQYSGFSVILIAIQYILFIAIYILVETMPQIVNRKFRFVLLGIALLGVILMNLGHRVESLSNIVLYMLFAWALIINLLVFRYEKYNKVCDKTKEELFLELVIEKNMTYEQRFIEKVYVLYKYVFLLNAMLVVSVLLPDLVNILNKKELVFCIEIAVLIIFVGVIYNRNKIFNEMAGSREFNSNTRETFIDIFCVVAGVVFFSYRNIFVHSLSLNINEVIILSLILYKPWKKNLLISKLYRLIQA